MNLKVYFSKFHYQEQYSFFERLLYFVLLAPSEVYKCIAVFRNFLYEKKFLKAYQSPAKVISIGNITTGGTGKTPIVYEFANYLSLNLDNKVAILSRGYGKRDKTSISVVKADNKMLAKDPKECGDEAFMLANMLDNVVIITGSKRRELAKLAVDKYNCNILLLDDGLQHKALARDLDIALIDQQKILGNKKQLPLGPLREPVSSLKNVDAVIWTNKENACLSEKPQISDFIDISVPEYYSDYRPVGFVQYPEKTITKELMENRVIAFTGIGQPESFYKQLVNQNITIVSELTFADHQDYTESDIKRINNEAKTKGIKAIVTTEKDIVKILNYINIFELPVYVLKMKMIVNVNEVLDRLIG